MTYTDLSDINKMLKEIYIKTSRNKKDGLECLKDYLYETQTKIRDIHKSTLDSKTNCLSGRYIPIKKNFFKRIFNIK